MSRTRDQKHRGTPLEAHVQAQICATLDHFGPGLLVYERTNAGTVYTRQGRRIVLGLPGTSDLKIYRAGGITTHMEIKRKHAKLRDTQEQYRDAIEALGHEYIVVRSADEVQELLVKWRLDAEAAQAAAS